jgi:nicotinate phosphoribosyltransferase
MAASALTTDLYELTMVAGYFANGRHERTRASFELFVRRLPPHRNYLIAAGIASLVEWLCALRFTDEEIRWLQASEALRHIAPGFFDYLRQFAFTGDLWAVPEGTPVFADEPLVRVTAPIGEAQLIETAALAFVNFQTSIASKASRVVTAAGDRAVMEFGARRAHGTDAALFAARSAFLAGCAGTSFVEAGRRFGIPLSGTMAHSWVMAAPSERQAFEDYSRIFGGHSILLLDTYDTLEGARLVAASGLRPAGVRLDSGDLAGLAVEVRAILDAAGLQDTKILASGDLDEYRIRDLIAADAPIDGFGVGTMLVTSADAPALGGVYKLVEIEDERGTRIVAKRSAGKATTGGRKQIWREERDGLDVRDVLMPASVVRAGARPLLRQIISSGRVVERPLPLDEARSACAANRARLPPQLLGLDSCEPYPVERGVSFA